MLDRDTCVYEIRDACLQDIPHISQIYNYYVLLDQDVTTFEEQPVSVAEMRERFEKITTELSFPFLVCIRKPDAEGEAGKGEEVVGYCYGQSYKPRAAYRFSCEDSIYLHPSHTSRGLGRRLLSTLLRRLQAQGIKQVVSVLGTKEDNPGSMRLHHSLGFVVCANYKRIGFKHGRWVDRIHMQKSLDDPLEAGGGDEGGGGGGGGDVNGGSAGAKAAGVAANCQVCGAGASNTTPSGTGGTGGGYGVF